MGMSEGAVDETVTEFFGIDNPYLGIYSKADGIHLRIIARARDSESARAMIVPVELAIHDRLGDYIWGYDDETPEQAAGKSLLEKGLSLAVMEMCTGGALTNSITDVPDSISYFKGSTVAYDGAALSACGVELCAGTDRPDRYSWRRHCPENTPAARLQTNSQSPPVNCANA